MAEPGPGLRVVRASEEDWEWMRAVRLAMLLDSPLAYASSFAGELGLSEADWRRRIGTSASWLACDGDLPVGSVTLLDTSDQPARDARLVAMWVAGHARGGPAAQLLVRTLLAHAHATGYARVVLDVADDNPRAAAFYRRMGFVATGRTGALPLHPEVAEFEMARDPTIEEPWTDDRADRDGGRRRLRRRFRWGSAELGHNDGAEGR